MKTKFSVLQGCKRFDHSNDYDMNLMESFDNEEEALKYFNSVKDDIKGWIYPILMTALEKSVWDDEEEELISYDVIEYFEFNSNKDVEDTIKFTPEEQKAIKKVYENISHEIENAKEDYTSDWLTINKCRNGRTAVWYYDGNSESAVYTDTLEALTEEEIKEQLQ